MRLQTWCDKQHVFCLVVTHFFQALIKANWGKCVKELIAPNRFGTSVPDCKSRVSKESTEVVSKAALMKKNLPWAFPSSGRLAEIFSGKVSILMGPCYFETANLSSEV